VKAFALVALAALFADAQAAPLPARLSETGLG
jgi:hypothetical protein